MDKQIEEMAKDIKASLSLHFPKTILYPYIAQDLYACGYRKIPENAVVLTREEYERLGKETVEKFAAQMKVLLSSNTYFVLANKEKLHKVIDEIAKEITEGVKGVSR